MTDKTPTDTAGVLIGPRGSRVEVPSGTSAMVCRVMARFQRRLSEQPDRTAHRLDDLELASLWEQAAEERDIRGMANAHLDTLRRYREDW